MLTAILAMPFQSVDGGSVFCEAEGSSAVISSRSLVSKHSSVLRRWTCFLCWEVRRGWEWYGLGQGSAGFPNSRVRESSGHTLSIELFPELAPKLALLVSPSYLL